MSCQSHDFGYTNCGPLSYLLILAYFSDFHLLSKERTIKRQQTFQSALALIQSANAQV